MSGGSAEYADYHKVEMKLNTLFKEHEKLDWIKINNKVEVVSEFLLALWSIHPFREGNTRTCITFLWHYLKGKGINFQVALLRNNPMYVRDSLVMANYDRKEYLRKIISDALQGDVQEPKYTMDEEGTGEQYKIAKADYESFREKYSIKKE